MSDGIGEPHVAALLKQAAPYVPGFAGAVMSLAFIGQLSGRGRLIAVCVGVASAVWFAPALAAAVDLFWPGALPAEVRSALVFLTGLCAMGCIPPLLNFLRLFFGDPFKLLKMQLGPVTVGGSVKEGEG